MQTSDIDYNRKIWCWVLCNDRDCINDFASVDIYSTYINSFYKQHAGPSADKGKIWPVGRYIKPR